MAKLIFYDANHEYELNGEIIPSVSEISRFASREIYGEVNQYALYNACERGIAVHKATELIDKYGECEVTEEAEPYLRAYLQFRKDYAVKEFAAVEKALASSTMRFAGTVDRVAEINGELAIIDLKSSSTVQKVLAKIQLNAYKILWEENEPDMLIKALYILHLRKDGTYKLSAFPMDDRLFKACYELHNALAKKKRQINITEEQKNVK